MKKLVLFAAVFICSVARSQETDCIPECSKRSVFGTQKIAYYQNAKMEAYDIKHLKLDLTIQPGSRTISKGSATYKVVAKQLLDSFVIEFKSNMLLDSVYVNNTKRNFIRSSDHIYIPFTPSIAAGTTLDLTFFYNGTVSTKAFYSGTNTNGLTYTASVSESYQAREWFPAKQLLNDKIDSLDVWITTNATNLAGSNGLLKSVVDVPGGMKQFKWKSNYKINYYLPMIAVGNYMDYRNYAKPAAMVPDSILIQHFIQNNTSYFNTNKPQLDKTPPMVEKQSELYGLYPFRNEKYGHAQAEIGGGMEHQTMSTMNNFNTSLIAHELGHQWFGDYVTCASWQDIWVNEGFARYTEYLMVEKLPSLYTTSTPPLVMQSFHANIMSQPGGSVYVPAADIYNEARIFSLRLSYDKGAAIIHNLRFEMQDDSLFFKTLKTYINQYKDTFATGENFKAVAEAVCGRSFTDFFNQWYYGQGYPTIGVNATKQGDSITLVVNQTTSMPSVTPFFKGLLELKITSAQGDTTVKVNLLSNNQSFKFPYKKTPANIEVDPNNWIINQTGTITVNVVTAISPVSPTAAGVKIYPKPTSKDLFLEMPTATFQQLQIFDIQGRLMKKQNISASASKLNVKLQLTAGTYTLLLTGKKKVVADKIVVM